MHTLGSGEMELLWIVKYDVLMYIMMHIKITGSAPDRHFWALSIMHTG